MSDPKFEAIRDQFREQIEIWESKKDSAFLSKYPGSDERFDRMCGYIDAANHLGWRIATVFGCEWEDTEE